MILAPEIPAHQVPCLRDLMSAAGLNLTLILGDEQVLDRRVRGVHWIDLRHPGRSVDREWVVLTTGSMLAGADEDEQRAYIDEVSQAGVTALGLGLGFVFDEVPAPLIAAAEKVGLPLFAATPETSFRSVVSYVHDLEYHAVSRRLELHSQLIATIGDDNPEVALVKRLAARLGRPVQIVDRSGHVLAAQGDVLAYPSHEVIGPTDGGVSLVVPRSEGDGPAESEVLEVAWEVLRLLGARDDFHLQERRLARAELLETLTNANSGASPEAVKRRLRAYGLDPRRDTAVLAAVPRRPVPDPVGEFEALAFSCRVPAILAQDGDTVLGLVQDDGNLVLEDLLARAGRDWYIGLGEARSALTEIPASARIAQAALRVARHDNSLPGVVRHSELCFGIWLLASMDSSLLAERAAGRLAALQEQPLMLEAVRAYLWNDLSIAKASEALFIHPNSLRYRLSRAELALGASLRNPQVISDLYLAILAQMA